MKRSTNLLLIKALIGLFIPIALLAFGMNYYANQCMENVVKRMTEIYAIQQESHKNISSPASNEVASEESERASHK
ncbi:hypothetical protein PL586_14000 [Phocaeicola vulgatus]|nr:hypothetical protein [Phocaeicola vulgatus]